MTWLVQVKFPTEVAAAARDGWVTVAVSDDMKTAAREAAFVHREREHRDDSYQTSCAYAQRGQVGAEDGGTALGAASRACVASAS